MEELSKTIVARVPDSVIIVKDMINNTTINIDVDALIVNILNTLLLSKNELLQNKLDRGLMLDVYETLSNYTIEESINLLASTIVGYEDILIMSGIELLEELRRLNLMGKDTLIKKVHGEMMELSVW